MPSRVKEFHSIMPIENIPSVLMHGILSHNLCKKYEIPHKDISLAGIQAKRDGKKVPKVWELHDYANLYFCARNPMMYRRMAEAENLCVLQLDCSISKQNGVVYTDQNVASNYARFLTITEVTTQINFDWVFADNWNDSDLITKWQKSSAKCAEILVPYQVNPEYIKGAYVVNEKAKANLIKEGFLLPIVVESNMFFW